MKQPFVKTVRTPNACYGYDVNTGSILKISPAVADILDNWNDWAKFVDSLSDDHQRAFRFVKKLQAEIGLFLSDRPKVPRPNIIADDCVAKDIDMCSHFILSITESCNFRCRYCVYSDAYSLRRSHSTITMPWNVAQKAIDILVETSRKTGEEVYLGFYGGEPMLRFDFIKQCVGYTNRKLNSHPHRFSITTNGSLLSDEVVDYLVENRFIVTISIDGPEDIHDRNRRFADGNGTSGQVIRGIERVREKAGLDYFKGHVILNAVLTPPYDLERLHNFFASYPSWLRLSSLEYRAGLHENKRTDQTIGKAAITKAMKHYCLDLGRNEDFRLAGVPLPFECFSRELRKLHTRRSRQLEDPERVLSLCQPGRTRAFVSSYGNIYVCERVEDNDNMIIGTVHGGIERERVVGILNDISRLDFSQCQDCWLIQMCDLCFAHVICGSKYCLEKWQFSCEMRRRHYSDALQLYCEIMEEDEKALDFLVKERPPVV